MKTSRTTPPSHLALRTVLAKVAFILTLAILSPDTYAGNNWDGGGGSGNWSEANNWNSNTLPNSNATLTFAGALQTITNNDYFAAGTTVNAFNFTNDGTIGKTGNFTLSGNSVTNTSADIVTTAIAVGGINLRDTISLNIALNSNKAFNLGAGHDLVISGTLSGSKNITKNGDGTLTLSAVNTYTGSTTISAGTLSIATITNGGVAGALGNSPNGASNLVLGGGTLQYTGSNGSTDRSFTLSNATTSVIDVSSAGTTLTFSGSGAATTGGLTKNGSGTLLFTASNSYTGDTTVNSGILQIGSNNRISDSSTLRVNGGTFNMVTFNDTVAGVILSANGTISGTNPILTSTSDFILESGTAAAILAGTVGVNKTTSGTVTLSAANTYTGATTINAGTLQIGNGGTSGALSTSSAITNNGTLTFNRSNTITQGTNFASVISGTGHVTQAGTGTLSFNGTNSYTGTTTISAGTLALNSSASNNSTISGDIVINGGTLNYQSSVNDQISNSATVTMTSGSFALAARDETIGAISMSGGDLSITSGVLTLSSNSSLTGGNISITSPGGGINAGSTGATTLGNAAFSYNNASNASAGLVLSSGLNVNANTTANFTNSLAGVGRISLGGSTKVFDVGASANMNIGWAVVSSNASGGLTKNGTGTMTLSAANTYTGATTINAGTIQLSGTGTIGSGAFSITGGELNLGGVSLANTFTSLTGGTLSNGTITNNGSNYGLQSGIVSAVLAGTNGFNKTTAGIVSLNAANTYTGTTTVNDGTLSIGNVNALQNSTLDTGTSGSQAVAFSVAGANTYNIAAIQGGDTLDFGNNTISIGANNAATSFTGSLAGSGGSLTKVGSGALILSGNNTYTGATTISAGTLRLGNAISNNSTISGDILINGGTLNYQSSVNDQISNSATVTMTSGSFALNARDETIGAISMSGGDLSITSGVLTLSSNSSLTGGNISITSAGGGINTASTGSTTLGNAAFSYNNASNASAGLVLSSGLNVNANTTANFTNALAGVGRISLGGSTKVFDVGSSANLNIGWAVVSSNSSGGLTKNGTGTLTLSAANTFSGTATINQGALSLGNVNALQNSTLDTGISGSQAVTFGVAGANTYNIGAIQGGDTLDFGSNTISVGANNATTSFTGILAGSGGSLTKVGSGSLTVSGANTYTGSTTISAGTLVLNGTNSNSAITVNSGGTLAGSGTGGATTINSGGKIGPGNSPGILTVGNLTLNGGATYAWEMADATGAAGTGWDQINATGLLTIGSNATSTFTIAITSSGNPSNWIYTTSNQSWDIIDYGTINGFNASYFTLNTSAFQGDLDAQSSAWALTDTGSTLRLTYTYTANTPTYAGGTGNWSTGFSPAITTGGNATFAGLGGTATNDIASATLSSIGGLTFDGINSYTLGANSGSAGYNSASALAIGGGVTNNSTVTQTINIATSFAANQTIAANTGSLVFGGNVAVATNATLTVVGNSSTTISGVVSGAGALTKNSNSTLNLSGNNTYSGGTTITTGTVLVGHDKAFGTGILRVGGTIASTDGTDRTISNNVGGLSGTWTYTFGQANGGTGNLTFTDTGSANFASTGSKTLNVLNTTSFASSFISTGNVSVTKIGAGTLILTGNSTYSGSTTINAGTLQIGNGGTGGALSASSTITNNGTLVFKRSNTVVQGTDFSTAAITGSGSIIQNGSGNLTLNAANTYSGGTTLNTGTLVIGNAAAAGSGTITQASGSSLLKIDTTGTIANNMSVYNVLASQSATLSGGITVNNAIWDVDTGDTLTISGAVSGSGGVTKNGTGTLILSGSNSYASATTVNAGTLTAANANALGGNTTIQVNGGSFLVTADDSINGKNITLNSAATGSGSAASLAFSGNYSGTVGALTLSQDSIIDLGVGSVVLHFADLFMGPTNTLAIYNWTGTTLWGGGDGNNTDQIYFDGGLTQSKLNSISFYSGLAGSTFMGTAFQLSGGSFNQQIIPVPEAESYAVALLLILGYAVHFMWLKRKAGRQHLAKSTD